MGEAGIDVLEPGDRGADLTGRPDAPASSVSSVSDGIYWTNVVGLGIIHLGALAAVVHLVRHPSLRTLVLTAVLYTLCGLSITAGYHRLFAHRTYRASALVRWCFLVFGAAAFQSSVLTWSADHRAHHADTDGPGDPHAVGRGWWWVHVGWLFHLRDASADVARLTDLYELRSVRLQHRFYRTVAISVGLVLPMAIASLWGDPWGGLLVAGFLRGAVMLQSTFCVNSLAHAVGKPVYGTEVSARDSVVTAMVTFGEGYHSFHHRFPYDYRNAVHWWQYDPGKWLIWSLSRVGLASRTRRASATTIARGKARALEVKGARSSEGRTSALDRSPSPAT
jgi:stearoyl-CoA desaturase (delta-9 desaturase)